MVLNERVMQDILPEIERLEHVEPGGFDRYIERLMSGVIPQPQTGEAWN